MGDYEPVDDLACASTKLWVTFIVSKRIQQYPVQPC